jgi:hypothetical protein
MNQEQSFKNKRGVMENIINNVSWKNRDIFFIYYLIVFVSLSIMVIQYNAYFNGIYIQFTLENFAKTLNAAITLIATAEGLRSFTRSANEPVGECTPVPAYKLRYLLSYLVSFLVLTGVATYFEIKVSGSEVVNQKTGEILNKPIFAHDQMTQGLLSNFICYLIARYGDKISENIDLSNLSFFKKK